MSKRKFKKLLEKKLTKQDLLNLDIETIIKLYEHFYDASQYWVEMYIDIANEYEKKLDKIIQTINGD